MIARLIARLIALPGVLLLLLLLLLVAVPPLAADYTVVGVTFLPQQFYVGDRVEMRAVVRLSRTGEPAVPDPLPRLDWGDLHHIRLVPRGAEWEVRVIFTAFQPGTQTIPPLNLGAVTVSDLSVHVPSILETGEYAEPAPPQAQLVLPGTRLWTALLVLLLVLLPLAWIVFFRRGKRYLQELVRRYRERQPYRRLLRVIRQLTASIEQMDGRTFYITLLEQMRRYISTKVATDCMAATTGELAEHLQRLSASVNDRDRLLQLFRYGDLVKFASVEAPVAQRASHLGELRSVVESVEQAASQKGARRSTRRRRGATPARGGGRTAQSSSEQSSPEQSTQERRRTGVGV